VARAGAEFWDLEFATVLLRQMTFLEDIFGRLETLGESPILKELRNGQTMSVNGRELLAMIGKARAFLSTRGLRKGDRCALLAHNSIRWVALDLAMMAEGLVVVPLYARQAPEELSAMMRDCEPAALLCGDAELRDSIHRVWPENPDAYLLDQIFATHSTAAGRTNLADSDAVTIIYTSGTSGDAKGVVLNARNIGHMLGCTSGRLGQLMAG